MVNKKALQKRFNYSHVRCLYCNHKLEIYLQKNHCYLLKCSNKHIFPVVNGIVYMQNQTLINKANKLIRRGRYYRVLLELLQLRKRFSIPLVFLFTINIPFKHAIKIASFFGLDKRWVNYLATRTRKESFKSTLKLLKYHNKNETILDIGCGVGQILPKIYKYAKPRDLYPLDISFLHLLFARKYFSKPETLLICSDVEKGLMFEDKYFDSIITTDTFHYIKSKNNLLSECHRVNKNKGKLEIVQTISSKNIVFNNIKGITPNKMRLLLKKNKYNKIIFQKLNGKNIDNILENVRDKEPYNVVAYK